MSDGLTPRPSAIANKPALKQPLASPRTKHKTASAEPAAKKTQRVMIRIRTSVHLSKQGELTTLPATTVNVTPQGAMILLKESLPPETRLVLEHGHTKERAACRVPRASKETSEGFQVPLEFDAPTPGFWKIVFPPLDWRPDEP